MLLSSFDNLQKATNQRENATNARQTEERLAVAEHIIKELKIILQNVQTFKVPEGQGLIIKQPKIHLTLRFQCQCEYLLT